MMRVLSLDVGDRTIGIAASDALGLTAQGVETIRRKSLQQDLGRLAELMVSHGAPGAEVVTLELSEERAALAHRFIQRSPYRDRIRQQTGDAAELLTHLQGPFDFVFIDAAKGQYVDYFHKVLPLLSSCGVVTADNVLFRGYVLGTEKPPRRYKTIVKRLREYIALVQNMPGFVTEIHGGQPADL